MRRFIGGFILGITLTWAASCASVPAQTQRNEIAAAAISYKQAKAIYDSRCEHLGGKTPPANCQQFHDALMTAFDTINAAAVAEVTCEAKQAQNPPIPCTVDQALLASLVKVISDVQAFLR